MTSVWFSLQNPPECGCTNRNQARSPVTTSGLGHFTAQHVEVEVVFFIKNVVWASSHGRKSNAYDLVPICYLGCCYVVDCSIANACCVSYAVENLKCFYTGYQFLWSLKGCH